MDAAVGGRLETLPPAPLTDGGDRTRLFVLVVVAVALHAWQMTHTYVTARDSVGFARYALRLLGAVGALPASAHDAAGGVPLDSLPNVLQSEKQPPGYPLTVALASLAAGPLTGETVHDRMLWSAQLAASIAGVLIVFPTYWLGRALFGKNAGFAAALLFQVLPVPVHITSDGLTDALYLLGVGSGLLLGVRALARPTVGRFLLAGFACGLTYLVRPEGLLPGLAALASAAFWWSRGRWAFGSLAAWCGAWGVGAMLMAAPYMLLIGGVSNKPSVKGVWDKIDSHRLRLIQGHTEAGPGAPAALVGATYVPGVSGGRAWWTAGAIARETSKGLNYAGAGVALLGLWASRRRFADPAFGVLLAFGAFDLAVVGLLGGTEEYVSERHVLPLVLVGCVLAGRGVAVAGVGIAVRSGIPAKPAALAVLAALAASCLPGALKPLHEHRAGHRHVGRYLAAHAAPADTIVDPFEWAIYFSGRGLLSIPPDRPDANVVWVVWVEPSGDPKKDHTPAGRSERMALAAAIVRHPDAELVYHCPEGVPVEMAQVKLFRRRER